MAEPSALVGAPAFRTEFDAFLAQALLGSAAPWPPQWRSDAIVNAAVERLMFHGVAGLLVDGCDLREWPDAVRSETLRQAQAQAMWEMEHYRILQEVLAALHEKGIASCLLKGTASAYEFYVKPYQRSRGDTDLLVNRADVPKVRNILRDLGLAAENSTVVDLEIAFQESWLVKSEHGFIHLIDLHWQALNSATLTTVLPVGECMEHRVAISSASKGAYFLGSVRHLLHTCLHRAMHRTAPYFVDGEGYVDNDRLIWATDISLIAATLSQTGWSELACLAADRGVSEACADSLEFAKRTLAAPVPEEVLREMSAQSGEAGSGYLLGDGRTARAWRNLASVPWNKKTAYLRKQLLPPPYIMRGRYPQLRRMPVIFSYLRRVLDLLSFSRRVE